MKRFKLAIVVISVLFTAALSARAQEKKMEAPKPGPEVKKLGYFVGTWKSDGELKENPFGMPAGKYTSMDKCEWFQGGFQVVCHTNGTGPMGAMHGMGVLSYNPMKKVYTYYGIDSSGMAEESTGHVDGNMWVYTSDENMGGKTIHGRYSMVTAGDSYTFKYETSEDGQKWTVNMDGKSTKAAPAAKK
jgi:hypothetical protein